MKLRTALPVPSPDGEGPLIPERRDFWGPLRRLRPRVRQLIEDLAGHEADDYIAALRAGDPEPITERVIARKELPGGQKAPWGAAPRPGEAALAPARPDPPAEAAGEDGGSDEEEGPGTGEESEGPKGPPTIVMQAVRPAIEEDLSPYLKALASYPDD